MSFFWQNGLSLLLLLAALAPRASASPSINVKLQASFQSPPYLVELLETAADEQPDVYFPILDRIADGYFDDSTTDEQLYNHFLHLLRSDQLITDPHSLSSINFALSIRNAAPRVEAHYHFYANKILPSLGRDCETWLELDGRQYCNPELKGENHTVDRTITQDLPFDRVLGPDSASVVATLYADITSQDFRKFHKTAVQSVQQGKSRYRIRHRHAESKRNPLVMSGYGVELALKRTDYIVIDDRQNTNKADKSLGASKADSDELADLTPLSASQLSELGVKAASFVASSENPFDTLLEITQDFPKHSASLAKQDVSAQFLEEHNENRATFLPEGYNVMWINGIQYDPRKMDVFSILDHLRRERRLVQSFRDMGLTSPEAIKLLSHPAIFEANTKTGSQRYDWRDANEGGDVILWLNNIEKDQRYKDWPDDLFALLQRTFPGQLPSVRRDINNAIVPLDFSDAKSARLLVDTIQGIIKRKVPLRWGTVPVSSTVDGEKQARIIYHLQDAYGLVPVIDYLQKSISSKKGKLLSPNADAFASSIKGRVVKEGKAALPFDDVLHNHDERLVRCKSYLGRLGVHASPAPMFVNGVAVKHDDDWLQLLSQQVSVDLRVIQQGVFENNFEESDWLPEVFLNQSSFKRNPIVIPENDKDVTLLNLAAILKNEKAWTSLPTIPVGSSPAAGFQVILVADFDSPQGLTLASNAIQYRAANESAQIVFVHNPKSAASASQQKLLKLLTDIQSHESKELDRIAKDLEDLKTSVESDVENHAWNHLIASLRFKPGESGIVFNGRKLGPILPDVDFTVDDFIMLGLYEDSKRHGAAYTALTELGLDSKIESVGDMANLCSLLSLSTVSDLPEGIFELPPLIRTEVFHHWSDRYTSISVGDNSTAVIQLVVALDPASETAQRWVPIFKAISQLDGVFLQIYLNPKTLLEELPVKRFYRYVVESAPKFATDGSIQGEFAEFNGIPSSALLTVGMDVPAAWLVTAKESLHDLDNIKLNALGRNGKVDATYELEYILIEGHSRDMTVEAPPAGVQLVLSTDKDPLYADTIIMSNLGYFQFKANPGHYNMNLKAGRSRDIFKLDSVGATGYEAQPGDETAEVTLLSFQGATLYPRLSRKAGKEEENILEAESPKTPDFVQQGANLVGNLLNMAGIKKEKQQEVRHADINIFSVASGHLYERMLNIMMVSVMRHTNHTVKFWFIEQFLSPSFKEFVPAVAKEYGFQYEMVTYKWPHWLRAQKEKQREIWGYKILFLDVLFPLDLDKVIFVDADQIVRTDMAELNAVDLGGAPYGFTPMCDSRVEMEGFRFWKQGYWKNFLGDLPYHISALYVVDLKRFRQLAAGDRLRQQYHQLSADPGSLSNLDQDLPNNMQVIIPIHSLNQNWLWCETWCSDESLKDAKTIDLCNNPMTKEPKLERARRQVPEWTVYDDEIAALARRTRDGTILTGNIQEDELFGKTNPDNIESGSSAESSERLSDRDEL